METPKEKANTLLKRMYSFMPIQTEYNTQMMSAKFCAKVAVQEIIKTFIDIDPKLSYWQEVKTELEKLKTDEDEQH